MRSPVIMALTVVGLLFAAVELPAQTPAASTPSAGVSEAHEGLTITARPLTDPEEYKKRFSKKNPFTAGIVALEVTFQNDTGDSLRLDLERIRLLLTISEDTRQDISPLFSEDVADRVLKPGTKDPTAKRKTIPLPRSSPPGGHSKEWINLEQSAREAGVSGSIIPPHAKLQGLLYFDLASQFDLLSTAKLYVPNIVALEKNRELFYFEIDLSKAHP